jgi:hypothetical protein
MSVLVFDGEPLEGEPLVGDTEGTCKCWARERMLLDGLSERGCEVEGTAAGGGMDMRVEGDMERVFLSHENVSTESTRWTAKDVSG